MLLHEKSSWRWVNDVRGEINRNPATDFRPEIKHLIQDTHLSSICNFVLPKSIRGFTKLGR